MTRSRPSFAVTAPSGPPSPCGQALLRALRPLRRADSALLDHAFTGLPEWATHSEDGQA